MAFRDFTFPQVRHDLNLHLHDVDLFPGVPSVTVREEFASFLRDGVVLALGIGTEKAKSEFIIAPVLLELRRSAGTRLAVFSGVEWNVDVERGLNGYCDFILTKGESNYELTAPYVAVAAAKNDSIPAGMGQCIAAMYAAQLCNKAEQNNLATVYGVVTTGTNWKFLRLQDQDLYIDLQEYYVNALPNLMGVLHYIVRSV